MQGFALRGDSGRDLGHRLDPVIDLALARENIVGTVLLVAVDGERVYSRAAGFADRESGTQVREDTIFRLASVTKLVVSCAALVMIDRRMIGLEEPIARWLPGFRPKLDDGREPAITIRHLLTHTAGLDYPFKSSGTYQASGISCGLDMPGLPMHEAMRRLASVPLVFEPGNAWRYSLATDVLGAVLERVAETPLPDVVRHLVTQPLGMFDTDFTVRGDSLERLAVPYADDLQHPLRMNDPHEVLGPDGPVRFSPSRIFDPESYPSGGAGMAGTASDILRLLETVRCNGAPILSAAAARSLTTDALPGGIDIGLPGWGFGLGVAVLRDPEVARTPHDAGTWRWSGAYGHDWFVNPSRRLSVVSFTNTAFAGCDGAYPLAVRDAIYSALTSEHGHEVTV
jgi:CubicO group peptidase (beta-lactamase class C family)